MQDLIHDLQLPIDSGHREQVGESVTRSIAEFKFGATESTVMTNTLIDRSTFNKNIPLPPL